MSPIDILLNQVSYQNKKRVKEDAKRLTESYENLKPDVGSLIHNTGQQSKVLKFVGTIPIVFQTIKYNIPVELFLLEKYPYEPPKLYVRPTSNMTIKSNHKHVDMEGLVFLPYLHDWKLESNLVSLISFACKAFSAEPPLFAKPKNPLPTPPPPIRTQSPPNAVIPAVTTLSPSTSFQYSMSNSHINSSSLSSSEVDLNVKRGSLIDDVTLKLRNSTHTTHFIIRYDLDAEFGHDQYLKESKQAAERNLLSLQQRVEELKEAITEVHTKTAALSKWEAEQASKPALDAESRLEPYDDLTLQIVKLNAEISAIDDAYYHMERCLVLSQNKSLDLNTFLKEMRKLARQQFLCKAHLLKINAICLQQQQQQQQAFQQGQPMRPARP